MINSCMSDRTRKCCGFKRIQYQAVDTHCNNVIKIGMKTPNPTGHTSLSVLSVLVRYNTHRTRLNLSVFLCVISSCCCVRTDRCHTDLVLEQDCSNLRGRFYTTAVHWFYVVIHKEKFQQRSTAQELFW